MKNALVSDRDMFTKIHLSFFQNLLNTFSIYSLEYYIVCAESIK